MPKTTSTATDLHTVSEAAERLSFSYRHVARLIALGKIDVQVVRRDRRGHRVLRITADELARFEATHTTTHRSAK